MLRSRSLWLLAVLAMCGCCFAQAVEAPRYTTEIPFHPCDSLICLNVALDGAKPRTLLLDTGNVYSSLTLEAAQALHWKTDPIVQNGKTLPGLYRSGPHAVTLGNLHDAAKFLILPKSDWGEHVPPADGSLAYTFFKDRAIQIDYPHHTLRISDVITGPASPGNASGTLQLITFGKRGPPIVVGAPFTVDGKAVRAQIDTCYTGTLLVYDAALGKLGLKKHGEPRLFAYTDGGVDMLAAPARSLGFGTQTLLAPQPTLYFVGAGKNPVHQPDNLFEATVGNALFAHSVVTLDFHDMTLDVRPAS